MGERRIEAALREATDTQHVNVGAGALASVPGVFRDSFTDSPAVVVADENTFQVAGKEVRRRLERAGHTMIVSYVFPAEPPLYAEYSNIEKLRDSLREQDAIPLAVGSGTINDIVKRSAHECERPYMCVATADSMDGYTGREAPSSRPSPNTSAPANSRRGCNCFGRCGPDCARRLECS